MADAVPGTVSVMPVKVFTDSGETNTSNLLVALNYLDKLVEDGAVDDLRVINMSLGMRGRSYANTDNAIYRAVSHLTFDHGVLMVAAGGNGDDNNQAVMEPMYPSDYEACLGVTALTETGANAYFSDYNQYKDISAPGVVLPGRLRRAMGTRGATRDGGKWLQTLAPLGTEESGSAWGTTRDGGKWLRWLGPITSVPNGSGARDQLPPSPMAPVVGTNCLRPQWRRDTT